MTPQQLKESIIQLAIEGKLVPQIHSECNVEDLYKQIQKEKQQLIKEGEIKKEKPLDPITEDEIPFDIPQSWKWVRFGEVFYHNTGKALNSSNQQGELKEYITTSNLYWNRFDLSKIKKMPFTKEELKKCTVRKGDLLVCEGGDFGRTAIWNYDYEMCIQNHIHRVRPYFIGTCLLFYYYVLFLWKSTNLIAGKGIGIQGLSTNALHNLIIPLPPLAEQKRIVEKIEELLPMVDKYGEAYNQLTEIEKQFPTDLKKSILQYAIEGKLVPQIASEGNAEDLYKQIQKEKAELIKKGVIKKEKSLAPITEDEIPFDIPESWIWVRLASVSILNPKNVINDELDAGFIPMPCVMDGFRNTHTFEIKKWKEIKKGFTHFANNDMGVAKITPCFQNRKSVIFKDLPNGVGAGTTELSIIRVIKDLISREYLLWFLKSEFFISNGVKSFTGTAGQQRIHKDYLASCLIPLPPLAEQKRIVDKIDELFRIIDIKPAERELI